MHIYIFLIFRECTLCSTDILLYSMLCQLIGSWLFMFPGAGWICYSCYRLLVENSGFVRVKVNEVLLFTWNLQIPDKLIASIIYTEYVYTVYIYIYDTEWLWKWVNNLEDKIQNASSAAQGGGGSFKNGKPTGEVGCRESRMAERIHWWTNRWLELCLLEWLQWLQWSPNHNCWM